MAKQDFYEVLGVDRQADEKTIRRAFRKLAKKYHPDTNQGNKAAEQKFKEINEAYAVLSDPKKKALYDKYGDIALQEGFDPEAYEQYRAYGMGGHAGSGPFTGTAGGGFRSMHFDGDGWQQMHFEGSDMDDILKGLFGHYGRGASSGAGFSSAGGFGGRQPQRGSDVQADITVSFEEAALGCEKQIPLHGSDGHASTLSVRIPAGMEDGKKLRLRGKGTPGPGGHAGDLYLLVHVAGKSGFERKGQDIYVTVKVPFTTAILGGEIKAPTLYGNVMCKIPAGTQSAAKIRLKGKGIPGLKDPSRRGDQYIVVQIEVPSAISPEQRELLRQFEALGKKTSCNGHAA